ncbi:MAG: heavy metal-binding domain-containing protein [Acidimicrobiales bacterium]
MTLREEVRRAVTVVATTDPPPNAAGAGRATTSDLTIDETLLLHSAGWEPVDLVYGISWWSIPWGVWQWTSGEVHEASAAFSGAVDQAAKLLRQSCQQADGVGVLGVELGVRVSSHHVAIELTGTAVRRTAGPTEGFQFVSDLSARDFVLLTRAGWWPLGLAAGASFVIAPRRTAREWAGQQGQNVELPNLTQALYLAREQAMERMQQAGGAMKAEGIVAVKLREGRASSSTRVVQFVAIGTGVHLRTRAHRSISPEMVVPLDERVRSFDLKSLRGAGSE